MKFQLAYSTSTPLNIFIFLPKLLIERYKFWTNQYSAFILVWLRQYYTSRFLFFSYIVSPPTGVNVFFSISLALFFMYLSPIYPHILQQKRKYPSRERKHEHLKNFFLRHCMSENDSSLFSPNSQLWVWRGCWIPRGENRFQRKLERPAARSLRFQHCCWGGSRGRNTRPFLWDLYSFSLGASVPSLCPQRFETFHWRVLCGFAFIHCAGHLAELRV